MNKKEDGTDRRDFLQSGLLGTAAAGLAITSTSHVTAQTVPDAAEPEVTNEVDVLVVGGGTAGHVAAIQAGRAGAKTLIVERNSQLGGTTTTGGVSFPGLFDAWGKQVIAGIGWELVKESVELDGGELPNFSRVPQRHWQNQVYTNQFLTRSSPKKSVPRRESRLHSTNSHRQSRRQTEAGRSIAWDSGRSDESAASRSSIALAVQKSSGCWVFRVYGKRSGSRGRSCSCWARNTNREET